MPRIARSGLILALLTLVAGPVSVCAEGTRYDLELWVRFAPGKIALQPGSTKSHIDSVWFAHPSLDSTIRLVATDTISYAVPKAVLREGAWGLPGPKGIAKPNFDDLMILHYETEHFTAQVVTVSTSCANGDSQDRSGPIAVERLKTLGLSVGDPVIVPDDRLRIAQQVLAHCDFTPVALLFLTGGTGPTPDDLTPTAIVGLLDRRFEGIEAAIHEKGRSSIPHAPLSRVIVGARHQTIVISVPGSPGGVRDALAILEPILPHLLSLTQGKQHPHA